MRILLGTFSAFVAMFFLTGCFQAEQVINVKPDGTGTIVVTVKMGKEALTQMKALSGDAGDPLEQMMKKEEAEQMATKMGKGVKLEKVEPYKEGEFQGKRATFSFTDINEVRADMSMGPDSGEDKDQQPIKFQLTKGNPAKLVILSPTKKNKEPKPDNPQEDAQMAAAASMLKDMRLTIVVNVVGTLVSTDADNRDGTRITMLDLPMGEAMKDIKKFKEIDRATEWPAAAKVIKALPGAKVETKEKVNVELK